MEGNAKPLNRKIQDSPASPRRSRGRASFKFQDKGQTLVELLLALGIFAFIMTAVFALVFGGLTTGLRTEEQDYATMYAQEGLDAARSIRDTDWGSFAFTSTPLAIGKAHGVELDGTNGGWKWKTPLDQSTSDETPFGARKFTREIFVEDVYRTAAGDIFTGQTSANFDYTDNADHDCEGTGSCPSTNIDNIGGTAQLRKVILGITPQELNSGSSNVKALYRFNKNEGVEFSVSDSDTYSGNYGTSLKGLWHLNEPLNASADGQTITDSQTNVAASNGIGNDGVTDNTLTYQAGKFSNALSFDGADDLVQINDNAPPLDVNYNTADENYAADGYAVSDSEKIEFTGTAARLENQLPGPAEITAPQTNLQGLYHFNKPEGDELDIGAPGVTTDDDLGGASETNLKGLWHLNEKIGTTTSDSSSNGNSAVLATIGTWTKYASNPMLNLGAANTWDDAGVYGASVVKDGTTYKMWYTGYDGATYRIGYATSADGITWTKYASNPVLNLGANGTWDDVHVGFHVVIKDNTTYKMWYTGYDGATYRIGYATSADGITWTKYASNPVLNLGASTTWDDAHVYEASVIKDGATYKMWYTGHSGTNTKIGYATSADGITWTKYASNPVLNIGTAGTWDDVHAYKPQVVKIGSMYQMIYTGYDVATWRIGYAISSDGIAWTKSAGNPVLNLGAATTWDDVHVLSGALLFDGDVYKLWYTGHDGTNYRIGYATASFWTAAGKFSNALSFDGADDYVDIPYNASLDLNGEATIEAWVYLDVGGNRFIFEKTVGGTVNTGYSLFFDGTATTFRIHNGTSYTDLDYIGQPSTGVWHHIAGVNSVSGGYRKIYIDGQEVATGASSVMRTGNGISRIGAHASNGYYFDGSIDEVAVYNAALTATQLKEHYERGLAEDAAKRESANISSLSNSGGGSWPYRKPFTINNGGTALSDYQVRVTLTASAPGYLDMKPDGADIRFTKADGATELPYWIETWNIAGTSTIWVKVSGANSIPAGNSTIYMHYGNANAVSSSDITNTFIFGDDFSSGTINTSKWTGNSFAPSNYTLSGGALNVWSTGAAWKTLNSSYSSTPSSATITEVRYKTAATNSMHLYYEQTNNRFAIHPYYTSTTGSRIQYRFNGGSYLTSAQYAATAANTWYIHRIERQSSTVFRACAYDANYNLLGSCSSQTQAAWNTISFGFTVAEYSNVQSNFDWIRVRQYASSEPTVTVGTSFNGTIYGPISAASNTGLSEALSFDGVDDYVDVGNLGLTSGTVEMWMKPTALDGDRRLIAQLSGASTQAGSLRLTTSNLEVWSGSAWLALTSGTTFSTGNWYHIAVVYSGGNAMAYINGSPKLTVTTNFDFSGASLGIGAKFLGSFGTTFAGSIDEVAIWNRVLDAAEIFQHAGLNYIPASGETVTGPNKSVPGVTGYASFTETAIKPADTSIDYQLSNDDGDTWCNYSGGSWSCSSGNVDYNQTSELTSDAMRAFPIGTASTIKIKARLNTTSALVRPELDKIDIGYLGSSAPLRLGTEQTIEAWVNVTGAGDDWDRLIGKGVYGKENYGLWRQSDGDLKFQISNEGTTCSVWVDGGTANIAADSGWRHIAGTRENNTMKLYLDGAEKASGSCAVFPSVTSDPLIMGYDSGIGGGDDYFSGKIDEAAIYNTALKPETIKEHYRRGVAEDATNNDLNNFEANDGNTFGPISAASNTGLSEALSFDGVDDYVSAGNVGAGIKSVEFWINRNGATGLGNILELNSTTGTVTISGSGNGTIAVGSGFDTPIIYINGSSASAALALGWNHVAIVDGSAGGISASAVNIGKVGAGYFSGYLDEVAIWDKALTQQEIWNQMALVGYQANFYATVKRTININYLDRFKEFVEMAAIPLGTSIDYQLSTDNCATFKYWDGDGWEAGGARNDIRTINRYFDQLAPSSSICLSARLNTADTSQTPILDNVEIKYSQNKDDDITWPADEHTKKVTSRVKWPSGFSFQDVQLTEYLTDWMYSEFTYDAQSDFNAIGSSSTGLTLDANGTVYLAGPITTAQTYTSAPIDTGNASQFIKAEWNAAALPAGTTLTLQIRSASDNSGSTWTAWSTPITMTVGAAESILSGITNNRWMQYQIIFDPAGTGQTPVLDKLTIKAKNLY